MRPLATLVVCLLAGVSLAAQSQVIHPQASGKTVETRTFILKAGGQLKITNVNGGVKVVAWDRDEVSFVGTFKPSSREEHVKVLVDQHGSELTLKAEQPKRRMFSGQSASVSMELKVPRRFNLDVNTVNGGITVEEVQGESELETVNGGVRVSGLKGGLDMSTVNGGIKGEHLEGIDQGLKAETVNGGISLELGSIKGKLKATTVNGGVKFNAKGAEDVEIKRTRVTATFPGSDQQLRISTVNGGITLQ